MSSYAARSVPLRPDVLAWPSSPPSRLLGPLTRHWTFWLARVDRGPVMYRCPVTDPIRAPAPRGTENLRFA